jgi:hypothetical protein
MMDVDEALDTQDFAPLDGRPTKNVKHAVERRG